jgi:protein-S-isoprenylcysteine O-methyltransferase Ste14
VIRQQHALVKTGVYRVVRHPMYASFLLPAIARALLLPNWLVGASGIVAVAVFCTLRVEREELMMAAFFGDDYRSCAARTKRIVPGII